MNKTSATAMAAAAAFVRSGMTWCGDEIAERKERLLAELDSSQRGGNEFPVGRRLGSLEHSELGGTP
jgi:hypothetical protein